MVEIDELKAENARLTGDVNRLNATNQNLVDHIKEIQDERRFEAAKSAMMGMLSNPEYMRQLSLKYRNKNEAMECAGITAKEYADALLNELEKTK